MARPPSAGILLFRRVPHLEVLLGHMGGPFFARKDAGAWSIPKGEYLPEEEPFEAARREFTEELGVAPPDGDYLDLGTVVQSGGKVVTVWAIEGDLDAGAVVSNLFTMEWPRGSGRMQEFPEMDRAAWFAPDAARERIVTAQMTFVDRLEARLSG